MDNEKFSNERILEIIMTIFAASCIGFLGLKSYFSKLRSQASKLMDQHPFFVWMNNALKSPIGIAAVSLAGIVIAFLIAKLGHKIGFVLTLAPIGVLIVVLSFINPRIGILICLGISFFVFFIKRMINDALPLGALIDLLIYISFIGVFFTKYKHKVKPWAHINHPLTYLVLLFFLIFLIQLFNPNMHSVDGWLFGLRKILVNTLLYFVVLFAFDSAKFFKQIIKLWLFSAFIAGAYGCYQEWVGFFPFENAWIFSSELRLGLIFVDGHFRKFSTLSDPTQFGIVMGFSCIFSIILMMGPMKTKNRIILGIMTIFMFLGMGYSGTRTAYAIVPAGLVLFSLMTINRKNTLIAASLLALGFLFILFGPIHGNYTVNRIRSTFEFSDDVSMGVRDKNRAMIQPYIYEHPMGGGVMTSGALGQGYNPHHRLAGFPPDSGLLRTAIEIGWTGLIFICLFYFTILKVCISRFYRNKDPKVRNYYLAFAGVYFAIFVAEFAQEVVGQLPCSLLFYGLLAILVKLDKVDFSTDKPELKNS